MPTINSWGSQNPAQVAMGGLGVATLTSHGILMGNGAGVVTVTAEPANGMLLIGKTGDFPQLAALIAGANVVITNGAGTITISASGTGLTYEEITDATKTMVVNYTYGANRGAGVAFLLPAASAVGDIVEGKSVV